MNKNFYFDTVDALDVEVLDDDEYVDESNLIDITEAVKLRACISELEAHAANPSIEWRRRVARTQPKKLQVKDIAISAWAATWDMANRAVRFAHN